MNTQLTTAKQPPLPANMDAPRLTILKTIESMSEETPCFQARLEFQGQSFDISNDGHGGSNRCYPHLNQHNRELLEAWAATNCEPIPAAYGLPEHPMDWETFTFQCAFDLLEYARPLHNLCKEYGLTFPLLHWERGSYQATSKDGKNTVHARKENWGWRFTIVNRETFQQLVTTNVRYK